MFTRIMIKQMRRKWATNLLLFLTMTALVSLYIFILNTNRFSMRSMQLIMKNMGHNQLIIPRSQSASDTYLCTERQTDFPDETTLKLAEHTELLSKYYVSVLQERMEADGVALVLTGIEPVRRPDETREKGNPIKPVETGIARLGSEAAAALGAVKDRRLDIKGRGFTVAALIPENGTLDDYRVFLNLADMQALTGKPGKINAILSFECLEHGETLEETHKHQKELFEQVLPDFRQFNIESIARGRFFARQMTDRYQYCILALVMAITVLMVVITGLQEVAERRYETGILVAQGAGYLYIMGLYLSKTVLLACLAAVAGFLIGGATSVLLTTPFLMTQTREVTILWGNLAPTVLLICLVALIAELIPMVKLVRMDPCAIVMEE